MENKELNKNKAKTVKSVSDPNREILEKIALDKAKEEKKSFFRYIREKMKNKEISPLKTGIKGILNEYTNYKTIKGAVLEKYAAYETVVTGATDTIEYYILLILSCLIATFGLYQNSPAVIIGAMIVAPLMGPIFGFSAGVLWGSVKVIIEAITTLIKGIIVVLAVTAALTFLVPGIIVTGEMMSRSQPTLFDTIVALCCGLVGAFAFVNKKISSAISGVAISVALMPPLCTVGIALGLGRWELAGGAGLLFAVNLIGISFSSVIVFYLIKLHPQGDNKDEFSHAQKRVARHIAVSVIILIIISIPLLLFTVSSIKTNTDRELIYRIIQGELKEDKIFSLNIEKADKENTYNIEAILLHEEGTAAPDLNNLRNMLTTKLNFPVKIVFYKIGRLE